MADPVNVPCTKDIWNLAATGVQVGTISKVENAGLYVWTYVMTTNPKPADNDLTNEVVMDNQQPFSFAAAVDIYVMPKGKDGSITRWV